MGIWFYIHRFYACLVVNYEIEIKYEKFNGQFGLFFLVFWSRLNKFIFIFVADFNEGCPKLSG
jgi:hypothetical protein